MRRMRIGSRLTLSFAIIILLTFLGSAVGLWQFFQLRTHAEQLSQVNAEALAILRVNNNVLQLKAELEQLAQTEDAALFASEAVKRRNSITIEVDRAINILDSSPARSQDDRYVNQLRQLADIAALPGQVDMMIALAEAGDWPAVQLRLENQVQQATETTKSLVQEIGNVVNAERTLARRNMQQAQRRALVTLSISGLLILVTAAGLGFVVTRSIARPLARLDRGAKALAQHDFDHHLAVDGGDELANLSRVFNQAASQLAELYANLEAQVQERTRQLQQSTEELDHRYRQLETNLALGQRIISILDVDMLLEQVVDLIRERYGYYYVGIFLLDESGEYVNARSGAGQAGPNLGHEGLRLKLGQGIIGWVAQHRRPVRVDDVAEDDLYLHLEELPDTRSELALPLAVGEKTLGVLDLQSDQLGAFRLEDMPVWQSLADRVAIAIHNAFLYEGEKSRRQLAETLYEVGRALSRTLELGEVLDLILEHLAEIVPYDRAAVMLQDRDELEIVAARGFPPAMDALQLRISIKEDDVFQQIYHSQQPLSIPDVRQRHDWQHLEGLPQARAWLGVPLDRFGRVIGMLSLTREIPNAYSHDQIKLATAFAGQAAIALENARLYDKITRFTQQLEGMVRDRTEAFQEAYIQLEHLDRTKSDFIKIAAHELRTPLTVLRGYSKMLLTDSKIKDNASHRQLVTGIHTGAIRLHEVVNSMLDITKIDNRALELYPEPLTIASLIQLVCQEFSEALAERNQTLVVEDMSDLPAIEADPDALPKVFYHLIVNAIKYTPDEGQITISGRAKSTDPEGRPARGIEIVVSDTGIGIDPENQELVFTKFYQTGELALHSTSKTKFKGAGPGLGLAIAQGIVEAHGGQIWVESPGHNPESCPGSRFHIFLPLRQKGPAKRPVSSPVGQAEYSKSPM